MNVNVQGLSYYCEGPACISDSTGQLLLSTDGYNVWNATGQLVSNGSGLYGGPSVTQTALILKKPKSNSLYYILTNNATTHTPFGLYYSIVDLTLAGNTGSVISKNNLLLSNSTEKLCAVNHKNGEDIWILTHGDQTDEFHAFLLNKNGLDLKDTVVSKTGPVFTGYNYSAGSIKFSPDGRKIGLCCYGMSFNQSPSICIADFDNFTGKVSNLVVLERGALQAFACEFSADSKYFYAASNSGVLRTYQWNVCSGLDTSIVSSKTLVATNCCDGLQLAIDGKIYGGVAGSSVIAVFENPNFKGSSSNFVAQKLNISPSVFIWGFPQFNASFFKAKDSVILQGVNGSGYCIGDKIELKAQGGLQYSWNNITGSSIFTTTVLGNSTVTLSSIYANGCTVEREAVIQAKICTDIAETLHRNAPLVYFINHQLYIDSEEKSLIFQVHDVFGNICYVSAKDNSKQKNLLFPSGIYVINVTVNNTIFKYKVINE